MALDLLQLEVVGHDEASFGYKTVPASWLLERLCVEADVCIHCPGENEVEMHAATYEVGQGVLVTDANGNVFRLRSPGRAGESWHRSTPRFRALPGHDG